MPHIVGERIYLREYTLADVDLVYGWRTKDDIVWWTAAYVWPESHEQARNFVMAQMQNSDPENRKFAICLKDNGHYIGHIGYEHLDLRRRNTELGIVLGYEDMLSRGYGTEAIGLFLKVCFEELGLHRVGLRVLQDNPRGIRCYEKCGFQQEGALRQWHYSRGVWHDLVLMSILEDEYRAQYQKRA